MVNVERTITEDNGEVTISKLCSATNEDYTVIVPKGGYDLWRSGSLIQDIFPDLTIEQREFMISGFTPAEFDTIFKGLDE